MNRSQAPSLPAKTPKGNGTPRRHGHNFSIVLSVDDTGRARKVNITHGQSKEENHWPEWKPEELIDFIAQHAGIQVTKLAPQETAEPPKQVPAISAAEALPKPTATHEQVPVSPVSGGLAGVLHLRNLEIVSFDANNSTCVLRLEQPYSIRLTMDLSDVIVPDNVDLAIKATILAKQPGKPQLLAGEGKNIINLYDHRTTINVAGSDLPPGIYLLEAQVTLMAEKVSPKNHQSALMASLKGCILEVLAT